MPNYPKECEYGNLEGQFLVHKASQVNFDNTQARDASTIFIRDRD